MTCPVALVVSAGMMMHDGCASCKGEALWYCQLPGLEQGGTKEDCGVGEGFQVGNNVVRFVKK